MKADKTRDNPEIDALLAKLGNKLGTIPFYAIFPAGRPNEPILLQGVYSSPAAFLEALKEAGPSKTDDDEQMAKAK